MKRTIEFKCQDEEYLLVENGACIFTIKASDLKFNSVEFYVGVYKDKSADIELVNRAGSDPHKKGDYIFAWLSDIISAIQREFAKDELTKDSDLPKVIPLFEFAVCAGDGFFIDNNVPHSDITDTTGRADFAVTVSGNSMEPTIANGSVIYIKKEDEPEHNTIGLFVVDGEVMCKRYIKQGRGYKLVPENSTFDIIYGKNVSSIKCLGRVLLE